MAVVKTVIVPSNLGKTIKPGAIEPNKFDVQLKSTDFVVETDGSIRLADSIVNNAGKGVKSIALQQGAGTSKLVFTLADDSTQEVDVSALATDVSVTGGTLNAESLQLTLKQDDGGPDVVIDLSKLTETTTSDSTSVTLTGNGTKSSALTAVVKVSATANNKLRVESDGLYAEGVTATDLVGTGLKVDAGKLAVDKANVFDVELQDAFGVTLGHISSTNA